MTEEAVIHKPIDKWIPWFFVMFFAVIAVIDGVMVTIAVETQPGVVTEHAYEHGLEYDKTIAAEKAQEALGWHSAVALKGDKNAPVLAFSLRDKDNAGLEGAHARAHIIRPVQDGYDFDLALVENGSGVYSAPVSFPLSGQWHIRVDVEWQDHQYQHNQTIIVP